MALRAEYAGSRKHNKQTNKQTRALIGPPEEYAHGRTLSIAIMLMQITPVPVLEADFAVRHEHPQVSHAHTSGAGPYECPAPGP